MAWEKGNQKEFTIPDIIKEARNLPEEMTDVEVRAFLGKFFRNNLGFTWEMISGQIMFEYQEILINGWFLKDYSLTVAGRGTGKSYLLAIFCLLYCIFYPNSKIVLVANNFRRVKDIFSQMELFLNEKGAILLRQCFPDNISKQNDFHLLKCANGSKVTGLPLGVGENLRGTRANVLIIDEGLLISEHIQETILRPFLTAKHNVKEQIETKEIDDKLISEGLMLESERRTFSNNKMIITSSASFQFEHLYKIYTNYIENIRKSDPLAPSYFVTRLSYEAVPEGTILDESVFKAAAHGGSENAIFQREYCARFVDASDGYFNVRNLHECTIKDGENPTVQVVGNKRSEYILGIDPSYSASKAADYFAMGVYLLIPEERRIIQVHSYGKAGKDLKEHYEYLTYIFSNFNIVYTVIDASGTEFIDGYNESIIAKNARGGRGINLKYISTNFESDEYLREIGQAKNQLNQETGRIVYPQVFNSQSIRRMNEYLQAGITAKKVWFGSGISKNEHAFSAAMNFTLPYPFKDSKNQLHTNVSFAEDQDDWISQTKRQLALIEVKSTALGTLQFDIPNHLKKSSSEERARRDNYTCLLMAYYASKHYYDILFTPDQPKNFSFTPFAW